MGHTYSSPECWTRLCLLRFDRDVKVLWQISHTMGDDEGGVPTAAAAAPTTPPTPTAFLVEVVVEVGVVAGVVEGGVNPGRKVERGDGVRD